MGGNLAKSLWKIKSELSVIRPNEPNLGSCFFTDDLIMPFTDSLLLISYIFSIR
uniref:Uncharacterized protein n=1 Tax=Schistosoma japonicum TaxID=6182 RepID=Q5BYE0_SCHJA|nr:unknown [Schistosoma japonicum]